MKRIIGASFPSLPYLPDNTKLHIDETLDHAHSVYSFPNLIYVLPQGDNVYYLHQNSELNNINDDEVEYYIISLYLLLEEPKEFIEWAKKNNKNKIIVGGYYPTLNYSIDYAMNLIKPYCYKIIIGNCDNLFATIEQEGQIVNGIVDYKNVPRYDLFNNKKVDNFGTHRFLLGNYFSTGCKYKCDFCRGSRLDRGLIKNKPLNVINHELDLLFKYVDDNPSLQGKEFFMFQDADLLSADYWQDGMKKVFTKFKYGHLFVSSGNLNNDNINFLSQYSTSMSIALEILTHTYQKNIQHDHFKNIVEILNYKNMNFQVAYIINPDDVYQFGSEYIKNLYLNSINELKLKKFRLGVLSANITVPIGQEMLRKGYPATNFGEIIFPDHLVQETKNIIRSIL